MIEDREVAANEDCSKFYDLYPSRDSSRSRGRGTSINGYFEDLVVAIAFAFDGKNVELVDRFAKDYDEGGIFFYTADEKKAVLNTKGLVRMATGSSWT